MRCGKLSNHLGKGHIESQFPGWYFLCVLWQFLQQIKEEKSENP